MEIMMMKKVFVVANLKGGIGKTTTAISLNQLLNRNNNEGNKSLLIDTDIQCNATDTFRANVDGVATLYDVLLAEDKVPLEEAIQHTQYGDIVAGDPLLNRADKILSEDVEGIYYLSDAIKSLKGYEYVVIDTAPALNEMLKSALVAADEVIIPLTADRYSIKGLSQLVQTVNAIKRRMNPKLKIAGLLLVAYTDRTTLGRDTKETLKGLAEKFGTKLFETTISRTVKVSESQSSRIPLIDYDSKCTASKDYANFYKELMGEEK